VTDAELNHLVKMANQIASNSATGNAEEAALAVASHIERFWAGAMRDKICGQLDQVSDELSPTALAALTRLK
jgi:formate dehydrogenase subunit delta